MEEKTQKDREWTVKQAARISGVSVRTLHYYDEIGLLRPARVTQAGYRLYGERELARLQQILLYRELDFPLEQIRVLLDLDGGAREEALQRQKSLLELKRDRLNAIIAWTERLLKGENDMSFAAFDDAKIKEQMEQYAKEAEERWGNTAAYKEYRLQAASCRPEEWNKTRSGMEDIFRRFAACMKDGPESPAAQALVKEWQDYITGHFYRCTDDILKGLGEMYTADGRFRENLDRIAPGLAEFLSAAIRAYPA